jgi:transposase
MEWGDKENRIAVIALHKVGMEPNAIFKTLHTLGISKMFVYRAINRYNETSSVCDRKRSGRPRSVRTKKVVKAVRERIRRNPVRKQKILSREMKIAPRTMSRILKDDLGLAAYKRRTGHFLTDNLKKNRVVKSKQLLKRYAKGGHRKILFTDEKIFTIKQHSNKQNDRIYAQSSKEASQLVDRVQRGHYPTSVMVWWGVSYEAVTEPYFCEKGIKTSAQVYQDTILEKVVKPLNITMFNIHVWSFQQDSAPGHKARSTQSWLEANVLDFIRAEDWPSSSPDLNPLDYDLWSILESTACSKRHDNLESLKQTIRLAVKNFPMERVRASIDNWPQRLKDCIAANGDHFE